MICGVKYCGGCNSRYNRTTLFERIKTVCPEIDFQYVDSNVIYDHLIVICGCPSRCADISAIQVSGDTWKIFEEKQFEYLISKLKEKI